MKSFNVPEAPLRPSTRPGSGSRTPFRSRLLLEKVKSQNLDIAFVEGSVVNKHDLDKLHYIRGKSKFLVALGACASIAGIPGMRNALPQPLQERIKSQALKPVKEKAFPITAFVKVDYLLQGCSINEKEFLEFLNKFLHGVKPVLHDAGIIGL